MVRETLAVTLLVIFSGAVAAADRCTKGSEFEPSLCPLILPKISKISIEENAAKSPAEQDPAVSCSRFILTVPQVNRYFLQARTTNDNDAHYTLDWSPCYASGSISFSDGSHGSWSINQFRSATLVMDSGEKMTLYCPKCRFRPFQW